jgi:dCTP deaminase
VILTGSEIKQRLGSDIKITPYSESQINPNSYNLRLHNELLVYKNNFLDMKANNETKTLFIPKDGLILSPNKLYLGRTLEHTETRNLVPMIEGRSSIGRLGMFVHITAGFGDVGFKGFWTLEISVLQPLRIYANVEICQIFFHTLEGEITNYKSGKYQDNQGIQGSMLWKDFKP